MTILSFLFVIGASVFTLFAIAAIRSNATVRDIESENNEQYRALKSLEMKSVIANDSAKSSGNQSKSACKKTEEGDHSDKKERMPIRENSALPLLRHENQVLREKCSEFEARIAELEYTIAELKKLNF